MTEAASTESAQKSGGKPVLQIIVGSVRPGRVGLSIAEWIEGVAKANGQFDVELVDLAEVDLPMMDEPNHPRMRKYTKEHTKRWSAQIDRADAFIFVMPEYNYGFSAALKNAIDYLCLEWAYKPVGLVSYGGVSAGTRGAQMIKQVLTTLKMTPLFEAVSIPFVASFMEDGKFVPNDVLEQGAESMLAELGRMEEALRGLRRSDNKV